VRDGPAEPGLRARQRLPYALFLPAFANVAQYHGLLKGPPAASPAAARAAAEAFVAEDYVAALHAGARLSASARAGWRGASPNSPAAARAGGGEEPAHQRRDFFFEALRPQGRIVGRLDARVTGPMAASRTREWEFDPGIEAIEAPYTMAAMGYFGERLGLATEQRYEVLSARTPASGTGTAAKSRATPTPAPAPTWRGRCGAMRT
jgi:hypothetical protein